MDKYGSDHSSVNTEICLTDRELDVLRLMDAGLSNQEIADQLTLSYNTVTWYVKQIFNKLGVNRRTQAVVVARSKGILDNSKSEKVRTRLRNNLPAQSTPFIGRETELTEIQAIMKEDHCRLLTLLGPGGCGKTRLAIETARVLLADYKHGVYFVNLAPLKDADKIPSNIASTVGFSFYEGGTPEQQLLEYLRNKEMLFVMDNFEHLLIGVGFVNEILNAAPRVKILVTSRTSLEVTGEHIYPVLGMVYPESPTISEIFSQQYSAIRLFESVARRRHPAFELKDENILDVVRICSLVEGMPLGIILAASWVVILSPVDIALGIARDLAFLEADMKDLPRRQRSMRSVFNHSWRLLSEDEREIFSALSVFRGGFTLDAAQKVASASLVNLKGLIDKTLLHCSVSGRFEIHELTRQYAAEKLGTNPTLQADICEKHSYYFCQALGLWERDLRSQQQGVALQEMDVEIENIHSAWNWAVSQHQIALLDQSIEALQYYIIIKMRLHDAERMCRQAAEHLEAVATGDACRVYARLLYLQGYFSKGDELKLERYQQSLSIFEKLDEEGQEIRYERALVLCSLGQVVRTSDLDEAMRLFQESLRLFQDLNNRFWQAEALLGIGFVNIYAGNLDEAQKTHECGLDISQELGDPRKIGQNLNRLDYIARNRGNFEEAERLARQSLAIYETIGDSSAMVDGITNLGIVLIILGKFKEAHLHLKEATRINRELDDCDRFLNATFQLCWTKVLMGSYSQARDQVQSALDWYRCRSSQALAVRHIGGALSVQGAAALALGKLEEAEHLLQDSIAAYQKTYPTVMSVHPYSSSGLLYTIMGQPDRAKEYLRSALKLGIKINSAMAYIFALAGVALLLAEKGDLEGAVEIYTLSMRYPWIANSRWQKDVIEPPLTTLIASLPPEVIAAARKRGLDRDLENTVQELLTKLT